MQPHPYRAVEPGQYDLASHFYPRVPNAQLHPLVGYFLKLGNERIATRFCHLHPEVKPEAVRDALSASPRHFRWSGTDLFYVTDDKGRRRFVVIETNSSPSGQKSMPLVDPYAEQAGYRTLLERTFLPMLQRRNLPQGDLAVLWDKNWMEVSGYAAALSDLTGETVHLVQVKDEYPDEQNVILVPEPDIPYEVLVLTMDSTREDPEGGSSEGADAQCEGRCLFPFVVIAGGVQN